VKTYNSHKIISLKCDHVTQYKKRVFKSSFPAIKTVGKEGKKEIRFS